uniref:glutathione-specific gamma-glutamylcyclotransferase n=1 Tax=Plectus sambesii TaxID=2011161 RepID=A0A914UJI8_9BILA
MWVFGYGSLLWHPDFPVVQTVPGKVKGYIRRFWQLSPDHRGTEEKPGRTVTLVPDENGEVWGIAYRVPDEHVDNTRQYLDFREKAGYTNQLVQFYPDDGSDPFQVGVYISPQDDNPYHAGPQPEQLIAEQIVACHGPSGSNIEYALRLAHVVRTMAPSIQDDHLFSIEQSILNLCKERKIRDKVLADVGYHQLFDDHETQN